MMKCKRTLLVLSLVAPLLVAPIAQGDVGPVTRGDLRITLEQDGYFIPANPVEAKFSPSAYVGPLRIQDVVANGKLVQKGDVLLRFEREPVDDLIGDKELDLRAARLGLEDARATLAMLGVDMELALAASESGAQWAKRKRDSYIQIELPLEDDEHDHGRQGRLDSIADQKEEIDQLGRMYSEDELTEETEEIVLRRSKRRLERSIKSLDLQDRRRKHALEHQRPQRLEEVEREVRTQQHALDKLRATQKNQKVLNEVGVRKNELALAKQARELERLQADRELFTLTASIAGMVYHGEADSEEVTTFKPKDIAKPHLPLLTIAAPGDVKAHCLLPEKDIFRVQGGMPVIVRPTAMPDQEITGILEPLDRLPAQGKQWKAAVKLENVDERLVPKMHCRVAILLELVEDALLVPKRAVFDGDGEKVCFVQQADDYEERAVELGKSNDTHIVVLSGLAEGEVVLLESPEEAEDKESP